MKTQNLTGAALDWAVAKAQYTDGRYIGLGMRGCEVANSPDRADISHHFSPSTNWSQGGPIIEREHISLTSPSTTLTMFWTADIGLERKFTQYDHDPLIAAMRCYCCSKLGDEVEVPDELA